LKGFRKLAHATTEELAKFTNIKVKLSVLSFIAELAVKYNNRRQIFITQSELERFKLLYEQELIQIYIRSGNFPSGGQVLIHRSGDVMEYFNQ